MRVLIPVPSSDFDPTESAIPWATLRAEGVEVVFATPEGAVAAADARMLSGKGLGPWRPILRATASARAAYAEMSSAPEFLSPIAYADIDPDEADGLVLPGGHAPGMKPYLESAVLQDIAADFLASDRPVGAICHGVLVLARARDADGNPAIAGMTLTALTRAMELSAWGMTSLWLKDYYRTYPEPVQDEVARALGADGTFLEGPFAVLRDAATKLDRGFTVTDGNLVTARWPGDAHRFAADFLTLLNARHR